MKTVVTACALVCVLTTGAFAQEIPEFNVERHCKSMAAMGGTGSNFMLKACYEQEQSTYDAVKAEWQNVDGKTRRHCIGMARAIGTPSYFMLHACVQQELSAKESTKDGFKLRR